MGGDGRLARGREAAGRLAWADAYAALSLADQSSSLAVEDLELLWDRGLPPGPASRIACGRCSARSSCMPRPAIPGGPHGARSGWRSTWAAGGSWRRPAVGRPGQPAPGAHEPPDCAERGYLLLPLAVQHIEADDNAAAQKVSAQAAGIGRHAGDADLVALALQVQGRALVRLGWVSEAMATFDEAMVAVVAGELPPVVVGTVY